MKIIIGDKELYIENYRGKYLQQILQENNIYMSYPCHGNGTCGKCKIKVLSAMLPITKADADVLSNSELEQGIRLACKIYFSESLAEEIGSDLEIQFVETQEENIVVESVGKENIVLPIEEKKCFLTIDIGTTTIAMALADEDTGEIYDTYTSLNHQREYGADVINRIKASNEGRSAELKEIIEKDLWNGIGKYKDITKIIIAGNTTMIHLLMGYSCEMLGRYPFISEHTNKIECNLKDILIYIQGIGCLGRIPVIIFPGVSAFIGGDIVAGISYCQGFDTEELHLLVDLGTNGEMVLGNKNKLLAASTAAGPAFEGGNIICGTAGLPGSICGIKIQNQRAVVKTIGNLYPPVGICGTGLVSAIAQLKENSLLDSYGKLKFPYGEKGYPLWTMENGQKLALYQKDIREFQMAKAAIRAGVEMLMKEYGCKPEEIRHVYLAGGFGVNLSERDAVITGILPGEFEGKMEAVGNSALKGCLKYGKRTSKEKGKDSLEEEKTTQIIQRIQTVALAENGPFMEKYLEYLNF